MKLVTRTQWKAKKVKSNLSTNITPAGGGVTIHYVGGKGKLTPSSHSKCAAIVRSIQNSHLANKVEGYVDIAYSYLVCQHGYIFEGRGKWRRSGANGTSAGNQFYYAVCALINAADEPTDELIQGLKDICQYFRTKGGAGKKVNGHKSFLSTSCPGPKLMPLIKSGAFNAGKNNKTNAYPGRLIKYGDRGSLVTKVQKQLLKLGYRLPKWGADGIFGEETRKALKQFQRNNDLVDDGILGPKTWGKFF